MLRASHLHAPYNMECPWRKKNIKVHIKLKFCIWLNSSFTIPYFPDIFLVSVYKLMTVYHEMHTGKEKKCFPGYTKVKKRKGKKK